MTPCSVSQAIPARKSVRTYDARPLSAEMRAALTGCFDSLSNPFDLPMEFRLLDAKAHGLSSPVIVGESAYIGAKIADVPRAEEAFGYSFERLVLYAASLGLGTVWIAGTMDRALFEGAMEVAPGQLMVAVTPIGVPAAKPSLRESMMRKSIRADERLPFGRLFFHGSFDRPLTEEAAGPLLEPLRMVRLGPSAVNKQPWRLVVGEKAVHFYEKRSRMNAHGHWDVQKVDVGIAMAHFALTAEERGLSGRFAEADPGLDVPADTRYIISWLED